MKFKMILDAKCSIGETPIWDPRIKRLYWNDLFKGTVHRYDPITGIDEVAETNMMIGAAIPCESEGKLMVAVDGGMMLLDFATGKLKLICAPEPNTGAFRYNDTRCDKKGRIFTSTVSKLYAEPEFEPDKMTGKFYMVDVDGKVVTLVDKLVQYNTIFFNNDNTGMYVIDTYYKKLLKFNYSIQKGAWGNPQSVIDFPDMPDGAAVDIEDNIYVAHWSEEKYISVYSLKNHKLKSKIAFPVKHICCPGFGGDDMKDFYVTTALFRIPDGDGDLAAGAGGIFKTRSKIPGVPEIFYKDKK
jgi:sugar lactone lactonase YvrE